ncbi:MAG: F0F1 ATP synthase subunit B [Bacteroidales bacterium]|nr:F0F1 ATP synthase subunit B [Bacteroidales bacterium]
MSLITPDFGLLFWMTLIFAIVFFILAKFGFPLITGMVRKRSDSIEQSLRDAEEARKTLKELAAEQKKLIEEARKEQARILNEAAAAGDKIVQEAKDQAREQTTAMIEKAREEIRIEQDTARRQIADEIAGLSVEVAEKLLRGHLDTRERQRALIDSLIEEARSSHVTNTVN